MIGQYDPGGVNPVISLDGFNIYPGDVKKSPILDVLVRTLIPPYHVLIVLFALPPAPNPSRKSDY